MSEFKIFSPKIERYSIKVSTHMERVIFEKPRDLYQAEALFIRLRDDATNHSEKVDFDRVRALLKYASCYNSEFEGMHMENDMLCITLSFSFIEELNEFSSSMVGAVNGASIH